MLALGIASALADEFANPLDVRTADPQVLYENGVYYMYGTTGGGGYKAFSSIDLVNWQDRGYVFRSNSTTNNWGQNRFWAPEVIKYNGKYYLIYSAGGAPNDVMRICIARADSPLGNFTNIAAPLFDDGKAYIDGHVFIDTNGQPYLYCSQDMSVPADGTSTIVVAPLNSTLTALSGPITHCIGPSQTWEYAGNRWNEAPFVIKHENYYYMLYSGNVYSSSNYSIGYATATSPLGPWTKYGSNPIVKKSGNVSGPGHCSVTQSPDGQQLWLVYHTHQQLSGGGARQLAIDKIAFVNSTTGPDRLTVPGGPSESMQPAPSGAAAFPQGGTDEFNASIIDRDKWIIFNETTANTRATGSAIVIDTTNGDTHGSANANNQNIYLQYPPADDFEITAKINFAAGQNYEQAALMVWQEDNNYIRYSNAYIGGRKFEIGVEKNAQFTSQQLAHGYGNDYWLRIRKVGNEYRFLASADGNFWASIGSPVTASLIDRKIGFTAMSSGSGRKLPATFDFFRVVPLNSSVESWSLY